jgi:hypothetical protein
MGVTAGGRTGVSAYGRDELFEIRRRGMDATNGTYEGRQSRHKAHRSHRSPPFQRPECPTPIRPHAETLIRFFCEAGTIGATKATLVLAINKAAAQDTRQSVTTGLIAGSDLVIVSISGVIKKYK